MPISSTTNRSDAAGNGITTAFGTGFKFFDESHLKVLVVTDATGAEALQVLTTDYTVTGVGLDAGGTVTMVTPPATGETLVIIRDQPYTQGLDLEENDDQPSESLEQQLDKNVILSQQLFDLVGRTFQLPDGFTDTFDLTLPVDINTPEAVIAVTAGGTAFEMKTLVSLGALALPLSLSNGGTGATTASAARTNLELGGAAVEDVAAGGSGDLLRSDGDASNLANLPGTTFASQAEAEAGTNTTKSMNPLRTAQAIAALETGAPAGSVIFFAANTEPTGWLECDGAAVSRTTYATLFGIIGTTFGVGDGSTTFNLPDLRGEFIRGWDNGKGTDSGRTFGSTQGNAYPAHTHSFTTWGATGGGVGVGYAGSLSVVTDGNLGTDNLVTVSSSGSGSESRPENVALLPCIKY